MKKTELIKAIATRSGQSMNQAEKFINAFSEIVTESLIKDVPVQIKCFGTFKKIKKSERNARNIQTGQTIKVPAHCAAKFIPSIVLRNAIK